MQRKCSSEGADCRSDDRACQDDALARGLEVVCDRAESGATRFVYCPPGGASRDSRVVWLLLGAAVSIAVIGGAVAYVVLKKKA